MARFVDLHALKTFMRVTNTTEDTILADCLDSALEYVQDRIGTTLVAAPAEGEPAATAQIRVHPSGRHLVLPMTHLDAVTAVTDPHGETVEVTDCDVNLRSGIVTVRAARAGAWTVTVQPRESAKSLALAVQIIAQHLYGIQRGSGGDPTRARMYGQQDGDTPPSGFAIPNRAKELLRPYVLPGIA